MKKILILAFAFSSFVFADSLPLSTQVGKVVSINGNLVLIKLPNGNEINVNRNRVTGNLLSNKNIRFSPNVELAHLKDLYPKLTKQDIRNVYKDKSKRRKFLTALHRFMVRAEKINTLKSEDTMFSFNSFELFSKAVAVDADRCFFGGWPSIKSGKYCRSPWKVKSDVEHLGLGTYGPACGGDYFRCNPLVFGKVEKDMSLDSVENIKSDFKQNQVREGGICVSAKSPYRDLTKSCKEASEKLGMIEDDKIKIEGPELDQLLSEISTYCGTLIPSQVVGKLKDPCVPLLEQLVNLSEGSDVQCIDLEIEAGCTERKKVRCISTVDGAEEIIIGYSDKETPTDKIEVTELKKSCSEKTDPVLLKTVCRSPTILKQFLDNDEDTCSEGRCYIRATCLYKDLDPEVAKANADKEQNYSTTLHCPCSGTDNEALESIDLNKCLSTTIFKDKQIYDGSKYLDIETKVIAE